MKEVPAFNRSAVFRCAIALASPDGSVEVVEGSAAGMIGSRPRGSRGFGYDPVFVVDGGLTFGELDPAAKDAISHRGMALRKLVPILQRVIAERNSPKTS
jgi:XTP/dITP diphosphohydrolase